MHRAEALIAARSIALLTVVAATSDRAITAVALFTLIRLLERHWEKP